MEVIPAIDLIDGRCVRLVQGDYSRETVYSDDPVEVARRWESMGASRIHIVDQEGARLGAPANLEVVSRIASSVSVPIQMGGGVRTFEEAWPLIGAGVQRVMLGTVAVRDPDIVALAQLGVRRGGGRGGSRLARWLRLGLWLDVGEPSSYD